jgi:hypothetical protein|tara:strand:+ start:171 stop:656 length:486 start_codon:yes stop_codon:yes gene_type:complete
MATRFFSQTDTNFFDRINDELIGDLTKNVDGVVAQNVVLYQVGVQETKTNMYGESAAGKVYKPGVKVSCLIDSEDMDYNTDEFGPDLRQNTVFRFLRQHLLDADIRPELGDVMDWNLGHWEISNINENQLVGGDYNKNWAVICNAFLVRRSNLQIERVRSI